MEFGLTGRGIRCQCLCSYEEPNYQRVRDRNESEMRPISREATGLALAGLVS